MDYDLLRISSTKFRDMKLKEELDSEKVRIIERYGLTSNEKLYWQKKQHDYPTHEYFSHKFVKKSSALGIVFKLNRLCYGKVKYFEKNWAKYIGCYYDWRKNEFVECDLSNMEFIKHKNLGYIFDLRNLVKINKIEDFRELCRYLEDKEEELKEFEN